MTVKTFLTQVLVVLFILVVAVLIRNFTTNFRLRPMISRRARLFFTGPRPRVALSAAALLQAATFIGRPNRSMNPRAAVTS